jgi:predicted porin
MKKLFFVVAAALVSTGAFAQNFSYGVKAGLNLSDVSKYNDDAEGADKGMRMGFHAGLVGEYQVNDFWGLQAELLYSQQGTKFTAKVGDGKMVTKLDYVNLPVMAKLYLYEGLSLEVGPQFGYLMSAKEKISGFPAESEMNGEVNLLDEKEVGEKDLLKRMDVSAAVGLSYKFAFGLDVSARYNLGLTKVSDKMYDNNEKKISPKNNVVMVGLGYRF